ncbi:MAG: 16S rRNA (cytosine(1402)-N(4))-methyltransferase, partial [Nitrospira sp.]|nr:16S rRNA (cytosine(1402)-N(4))-methyltransferase [Nitrospira sp.]
MAVFSHIPVLPEEVLRWILPHAGGRYLDCTLGQGELAARILEQSAPSGYLIGIDRD